MEIRARATGQGVIFVPETRQSVGRDQREVERYTRGISRRFLCVKVHREVSPLLHFVAQHVAGQLLETVGWWGSGGGGVGIGVGVGVGIVVVVGVVVTVAVVGFATIVAPTVAPTVAPIVAPIVATIW